MQKGLLLIVCFVLTFASSAQFDQIEEQIKSKPQSEETAIWLCDTAFSLHRKDPQLAQKIAELAKEKATLWKSDLALAKSNHVLGVTFWIRDEYEEALSYYLEALNYYEDLNQERGMAIINMNIGIIYDDLDQTNRSKQFYRKSEQQFRSIQDSTNLARVLNNTAVALRRSDEIDSALNYYKECLAIRLTLNDSSNIASTYNNIANLYIEKDSDIKFEDAEFAYDNLIAALKYVDHNDRTYVLTQVNMGKALTILGRFDQAEAYLEEALFEAKKKNYRIIEQWAFEYFARLYQKKGDYKSAYEYYSKSVQIDKELRNEEVNMQIDELNIKYETEKRDRQLAELERQKAIDQGIRNLLMIGITSVILVALLLILFVSQKRRKDKLAAKLKLQEMANELNIKNKEIASYTMSFLQKNQLMEELKEQINTLKKSSDISTNKELTRINRIVDNTFRSDEEWKTFQVTFDQMHDGFFKDLKKEFPDISNAELKLCALLRLNMNLKESAKILGIAADSVKTARYRLRKKLGLKTEDNLVDFLIQFEDTTKATSD